MFIALLTAAFAQAAPAAAPAATAAQAPAVAGRSLAALPNTTVGYYDVQGKNAAAIKKSFDAAFAAQNGQLFVWDVAAQVSKRTEGTKCTVQKATAKLTSKVQLPRLAEPAKVAKPALAAWQAFAASTEADAAANLWFIHDGLRGVEQAVTGVDCAALTPAWNAALAKLKADQAAFAAQRVATANAAAAAAAAATKPAATSVSTDEKEKLRRN